MSILGVTAQIRTTNIESTPWATREFYIKDNQGHVLCFSQAM